MCVGQGEGHSVRNWLDYVGKLEKGMEGLSDCDGDGGTKGGVQCLARDKPPPWLHGRVGGSSGKYWRVAAGVRGTCRGEADRRSQESGASLLGGGPASALKPPEETAGGLQSSGLSIKKQNAGETLSPLAARYIYPSR